MSQENTIWSLPDIQNPQIAADIKKTEQDIANILNRFPALKIDLIKNFQELYLPEEKKANFIKNESDTQKKKLFELMEKYLDLKKTENSAVTTSSNMSTEENLSANEADEASFEDETANEPITEQDQLAALKELLTRIDSGEFTKTSRLSGFVDGLRGVWKAGKMKAGQARAVLASGIDRIRGKKNNAEQDSEKTQDVESLSPSEKKVWKHLKEDSRFKDFVLTAGVAAIIKSSVLELGFGLGVAGVAGVAAGRILEDFSDRKMARTIREGSSEEATEATKTALQKYQERRNRLLGKVVESTSDDEKQGWGGWLLRKAYDIMMLPENVALKVLSSANKEMGKIVIIMHEMGVLDKDGQLVQGKLEEGFSQLTQEKKDTLKHAFQKMKTVDFQVRENIGTGLMRRLSGGKTESNYSGVLDKLRGYVVGNRTSSENLKAIYDKFFDSLDEAEKTMFSDQEVGKATLYALRKIRYAQVSGSVIKAVFFAQAAPIGRLLGNYFDATAGNIRAAVSASVGEAGEQFDSAVRQIGIGAPAEASLPTLEEVQNAGETSQYGFKGIGEAAVEAPQSTGFDSFMTRASEAASQAMNEARQQTDPLRFGQNLQETVQTAQARSMLDSLARAGISTGNAPAQEILRAIEEPIVSQHMTWPEISEAIGQIGVGRENGFLNMLKNARVGMGDAVVTQADLGRLADEFNTHLPVTLTNEQIQLIMNDEGQSTDLVRALAKLGPGGIVWENLSPSEQQAFISMLQEQ